MIERKTSIIAIIALLYIAAAGCVFSWSMYEIARAGNSLEERIQAIADTSAQEKAYKDLSALAEETQDERELLSLFVLEEDETGDFLTSIEKLGSQQGITLVTQSLKVEKQKDGPDHLNVQFALEGQEQNVKRMLSMFETMPYYSKVTSLTFERKDGGMADSTIGLEISLLNP